MKIKLKQNYTPNDVGMMLGVHHNTIKNWIKSKQIVAFKTVGGHYRVPRREVVNLIKSRGLPIPEELQGSMGVVYIVDDDRLIRNALQEELKASSFEAYSFSNGFDALMQMGRLKPDLIILDIFMPGIDGFALVKRIRNDEKLASIHVVGMSGRDVDVSKALAVGFDDFFHKSGGLEPVIDNVKGFLGTVAS
ncbi:MAG: response regulator [Deltaproteobacteria bacterium]|nr:response regulator [Deltaproteobacteria bacterium]